MLEVKTPYGTLVARPDTNPDFPGIAIYLRRGQREVLLSCVETQFREMLLVHYGWFNSKSCTPSYTEFVSPEQIDELFAEEGWSRPVCAD